MLSSLVHYCSHYLDPAEFSSQSLHSTQAHSLYLLSDPRDVDNGEINTPHLLCGSGAYQFLGNLDLKHCGS